MCRSIICIGMFERQKEGSSVATTEMRLNSRTISYATLQPKTDSVDNNYCILLYVDCLNDSTYCGYSRNRHGSVGCVFFEFCEKRMRPGSRCVCVSEVLDGYCPTHSVDDGSFGFV